MANLALSEPPCSLSALPEGAFVLATDGTHRKALKCGVAVVLGTTLLVGLAGGWYAKSVSLKKQKF